MADKTLIKRVKKSISMKGWGIIVLFNLLFILFNEGILAEEKLPIYKVKKITNPLIIDGVMNEVDWQMAESFNLCPVKVERKKSIIWNEEDTIVKMLWDEKNLYVFYKCQDRDIIAANTKRDSNVCEDDCVEIFISPDSQKVHIYFNFEINARGTLLDHARICDRTPWIILEKWDADIKLGHLIEGTLNNSLDKDECWTMELAIPFRNFLRVTQVPKEGDRWRLNLYRLNYSLNIEGTVGKKVQTWFLSPKGHQGHHPESFGTIIFCSNQAVQ